MNVDVKNKWRYIGIIKTVEKYHEYIQVSICGRSKSDGIVGMADHFRIVFEI